MYFPHWFFFNVFFLKIIFIYIFIFLFGCAGSLLLHRLFSSYSERGLLSSCGARASPCSGLSCCRALGEWASVVLAPPGSVAPQHVGSFWTRDRTLVSCTGRQILCHWVTRETLDVFLTPWLELTNLITPSCIFFLAMWCLPQPGSEPVSPEGELWNPNHCATREVPSHSAFWKGYSSRECFQCVLLVFSLVEKSGWHEKTQGTPMTLIRRPGSAKACVHSSSAVNIHSLLLSITNCYSVSL